MDRSWSPPKVNIGGARRVCQVVWSWTVKVLGEEQNTTWRAVRHRSVKNSGRFESQRKTWPKWWHQERQPFWSDGQARRWTWTSKFPLPQYIERQTRSLVLDFEILRNRWEFPCWMSLRPARRSPETNSDGQRRPAPHDGNVYQEKQIKHGKPRSQVVWKEQK